MHCSHFMPKGLLHVRDIWAIANEINCFFYATLYTGEDPNRTEKIMKDFPFKINFL